ncbi:hypothetical protein B484DRAFT_454699 [Ochromonadaceae sp. CCMP2298]|nr:hypothetical protein B484DRAFT_454699 [Ochromonadaceae sp. CCMP2298]
MQGRQPSDLRLLRQLRAAVQVVGAPDHPQENQAQRPIAPRTQAHHHRPQAEVLRPLHAPGGGPGTARAGAGLAAACAGHPRCNRRRAPAARSVPAGNPADGVAQCRGYRDRDDDQEARVARAAGLVPARRNGGCRPGGGGNGGRVGGGVPSVPRQSASSWRDMV